MIGKRTAFLGITLIILVLGVLSTSTIFAAGTTAKIFAINGSGKFKVPAGDATLTLTLKNGEIKIEAATTRLEPGHALSVWGIINDEPAFNLTGFITDDDGEAGFSGTVQLDKDDVLVDFEIIIKEHGDPIKGLIHKQKTTKTVGCNLTDPDNPTGDTICIDRQNAVININIDID